MSFLSEDPWMVASSLALLGAMFLLVLKTTGQGKYLIWSLGTLGLAGLIVLVEWLWVTDNERIEQVVYNLRRAVAASDVQGVFAHLTDDVEFTQSQQALSGSATRQLIQANLSRAKFDFVKVGSLVVSHGAATRHGKAEFQVYAKGTMDTSLATLNVGTANSAWSLGFVETSPGVWKVNRITALRGMEQEPLSIPRSSR